MKPSNLVLSLSLVATSGCLTNYQSEYSGDIPILVTNKGAKDLAVFIRPADKDDDGKRWGDEISAGSSATFKVKPGRYDLVLKGMYMSTASSEARADDVDVAGPMEFVVADGQVEVAPNQKLLVMVPYGGAGGGGGGGGGGGEEEAACKPNGEEAGSNTECCGGGTEPKVCLDSDGAPDPSKSCGYVCCTNSGTDNPDCT